MWVVQTTDGVAVLQTIDPRRPVTQEAAERSAQERNGRAEDMGLEVRYEAIEVEG